MQYQEFPYILQVHGVCAKFSTFDRPYQHTAPGKLSAQYVYEIHHPRITFSALSVFRRRVILVVLRESSNQSATPATQDLSNRATLKSLPVNASFPLDW